MIYLNPMCPIKSLGVTNFKLIYCAHSFKSFICGYSKFTVLKKYKIKITIQKQNVEVEEN